MSRLDELRAKLAATTNPINHNDMEDDFDPSLYHSFMDLYAVDWDWFDEPNPLRTAYDDDRGHTDMLERNPYDFVWRSGIEGNRSIKERETLRSLCHIGLWAERNLDYYPKVWVSVTMETDEDLVIRFESEEDFTLFRLSFGHRLFHQKMR